MKRTLAMFILVALLLPLVACGGGSLAPAETEPGTGAAETKTKGETLMNQPIPKVLTTELPNYELQAGASTDEIRAMAVSAMRDELSVQWTVPQAITYQKENAGAGKDFSMNTNTVYAGLPYTDARTSLFHFLQFYDPETGSVRTDSGTINEQIGNACSGSVMWGWSAVSTSVFWTTTKNIAPGSGALPVGPYEIDRELMSFTAPGQDTFSIAKRNGEEVLYASYAECLPADGLIALNDKGSGHTMMVIEPAHVEKTASGAIDPEKSFLVIQDQRMGLLENAAPYVVKEDGQTHHYAGRLRAEISFKTLFGDGYLPVTAAEFIGEKPYTVPTASLEGDPAAPEGLYACRVTSPYKIITVTLTVTDGAGKEVYTAKKTLTKTDLSTGASHDFPLENLNARSALSRRLTAGESCRAALSVLLSSGTTVTVWEGDLVA